MRSVAIALHEALPGRPVRRLRSGLLVVSFVNLLLVALLGLLLRAYALLPGLPFSYHNLLHGHSHFAFGGWVQPVLLALLLQAFPELTARVPVAHWRNVAVLLLVSAWGMLFTFPVQGYAAASITFSTLSIAGGVYQAVISWRALRGLPETTSRRFLSWGVFWMLLSAIGPFATGPLAARGGLGSPLYMDAIYWYLHFQYNGFFSFAVLALLYRRIEAAGADRHGGRSFALFQAAALPTYALSVLWSGPGIFFNLLGGIGAVLQLAAFFLLLRDLLRSGLLHTQRLLWLPLSALALKLLLQALSALPFIAQLAYRQRPFVIAYLHLVLLGFISGHVFAQFSGRPLFRRGVGLFLVSFVSTELLLVAQASGVYLPQHANVLLAASALFPVGVSLMLLSLARGDKKASVPVAPVRTTARPRAALPVIHGEPEAVATS